MVMSGIWLVSYIALWILFLIIAIVLISVLHHIGVLYGKVEGDRQPPPTILTPGEALPEVTFSRLNGELVPLSRFLGKPVAFLVISPGCSGCIEALQSFANHDQHDTESPIKNPIVVGLNDKVAISKLIQQVQLPPSYQILMATDNTIQKKWGVRLTPILIEANEELKLSRQTIFVGR
jgi:hypothetical protein